MNLMYATGLLAVAYSLCVLGCTLLALSQARHWQAIVKDRKSKPPRIAGLGWGLVLLSLLPCLLRDGSSFAALLWPLVFAASAMSVAMLLAFRPYSLKPLAAFISRL
ncbi:MAG: DUF3325 family protein [Pseudomonadota bacterium]